MRRHWKSRWAVWAAASLALITLSAPAIPAATKSDAGSQRAWLGVYSQELTEELRDGIDYSGRGVLINRVITGSPADRAGLRKGDVITSINSRNVESPSELASVVRDLGVGRTVSVGIMRDGARRSLSVTLAARSEDEESAPEMQKDEDGDQGDGDTRVSPHVFRFKGMPEGFEMYGIGRGRLGVRVESLNPDLAGYFNVPGGRGVLVIEVLKGTPAERAGLKAGDVITAVGDQNVYDTGDLTGELGKRTGAVGLTVVRKGARRAFEAQLERTPRAFRWNDGDGFMGLNDKDKVEVRRYGSGSGGSDDADLREQMRQLREELKQLREEMRKQQNN